MDNQIDQQKPSSKETNQVTIEENEDVQLLVKAVAILSKALLHNEAATLALCIAEIGYDVGYDSGYDDGRTDDRQECDLKQFNPAENIKPEPQPTPHATQQASLHVDPKDSAAEVAKHLWNQPVTKLHSVSAVSPGNCADWVSKAVESVSSVIETIEPNSSKTSNSSFAVGDEVESIYGRGRVVDINAAEDFPIGVRYGNNFYAAQKPEGLKKADPPTDPQYRDVTLVDVGKSVEVRDSKNKTWLKRRLTGFVSKDHPGFAEGFRFVCGLSNWKYARIKIGGEA